MIRVDIETIVMASGHIPSVIVLRERSAAAQPDAIPRALSIQTGSYEAAAISQGIGSDKPARPITHDLVIDVVEHLKAKVVRVQIERVEAPVFYASVILAGEDGQEHALDARPSDAIAIAVRANAPIYVEDDVMNRAGSAVPQSGQDAEQEFERFDRFVQTLSPDDF